MKPDFYKKWNLAPLGPRVRSTIFGYIGIGAWGTHFPSVILSLFPFCKELLQVVELAKSVGFSGFFQAQLTALAESASDRAVRAEAQGKEAPFLVFPFALSGCLWKQRCSLRPCLLYTSPSPRD